MWHMGVPIVIWNRKRRDERRRQRAIRGSERRHHRAEQLEPRQLLAANPIHLGVVYLETDYLESDSDVGGDSRGDRFIVSFTGGAPDTKLAQLRIRTDKDSDGISVGDPIYDTEVGGLGKNGAHSFRLLTTESANGEAIEAVAEVSDGGQELVLRLSNFRAGDRLEFSIDVDEVLRNSTDLDVFNDRLDVITSGQEFQDSILEATFLAPRFKATQADSVFLNDFGDPLAKHGLRLPADEGADVDSRPNRSAAALISTVQTPKPIEISGHVWIDNDLNAIRQSNEAVVRGVEIALWRQDGDGNYLDTGLRSVTDTNGKYVFPKSLGLMPGTYRIVQRQPADLLSVAAVPGFVISGSQNTNTGTAQSSNELTDIQIPFGDSVGSQYDFAEAEMASLSGHVFVDDDGDGTRQSEEQGAEPGIAGVQLNLIPMETIGTQTTVTVQTDANGAYTFADLAPGHYQVIQVDQPATYVDGVDTPGTISGERVGVATNPGDRIEQIRLAGGDIAIDYNFGEIPLGILAGSVFLAAPDTDCAGADNTTGNIPLPGVQLSLQNESGDTIATTTTDSAGQYRFERIPPGTYQVREQTPVGLLDGTSHPGRIGETQVGMSIDGGSITEITINGGATAEDFDFCEAAPATISGVVFHDRNDNGNRESEEEGVGQVLITLVQSDGRSIASQLTDNEGRYLFGDLIPGQYTIRQTQPTDWIDGRDRVGTIAGEANGTTSNDELTGITLRQGQQGFDYNFGERLPASLTGRVHADVDGDCELDPTEATLGGVTLRLIDESGQQVARTTTQPDGTYKFQGLDPGIYTLIQVQPDNYFDGSAKAGTAGGGVSGTNRIEQIVLRSGEMAVDYDFCEHPGSGISGIVLEDANENCLLDPGELGLRDVQIDLLDSDEQKVATTRTDSTGRYQFNDLPTGTYTLREIQPLGWFHGGQLAGDGGGDASTKDLITAIELNWGQAATNYNFCEISPASISGLVWQESIANGTFDQGDQPIAGVQVELLDSTGRVIHSIKTDSTGEYLFSNLQPGTYTIRETQPDGLFHGGQSVGDSGGEVIGQDLIGGVQLQGGTTAGAYNFYESPPARLSGYVFQDGEPLTLIQPPDPSELRQLQDGVRTDDDQGLEGVVMELRNGRGSPAGFSDTLPNLYPDGPIRVTTNAEGYYEFSGIRAGTYHIYQTHPEDFVDGLDTPGSSGGFAVNEADTMSAAAASLIQTLVARAETDPHRDAILGISVMPGENSKNNNFSELVVVDPPTPPLLVPLDLLSLTGPLETPNRFTGDRLPDDFSPKQNRPILPASFSQPAKQIPYAEFNNDWAVSWHLSVINGGYPRGTLGDDGIIRQVSSRVAVATWQVGRHATGRWVTDNGEGLQTLRNFSLGEAEATALAGDFDGDGSDEAVIFVAGQWFVDINGNGRWDARDLWIQLGNELDRPVVGDWDGDGKDDVGIFGRQWQHDTRRIPRDPGLPDPANTRRRQIDAPGTHRTSAELAAERAPEPPRLLRRNQDGELRADAVDHVFQYGEQADRPVVGDWNGDGIDQVAIFNGGRWLLDQDGDGRPSATDVPFVFGSSGDQPVAGDFNGDGIDEIGVVRGQWWIIDTDGDRRLTGNDLQIEVPRNGGTKSQPVLADWDGDGKDNPGYYSNAE